METEYRSEQVYSLGGNDIHEFKTEKRQLQRRLRIAFYSHDTMGLGHIRRNLLIAQTLAYSKFDPNILLIAGTKKLAKYSFPPNLDCVILPSYHKQNDGEYSARKLDISGSELAKVRSDTISAILKSYVPDVFIVDNVARGALGELDSILVTLKQTGHTRCILGLRDIQDNKQASDALYQQDKEAIDKYYDMVWVYGDPNVYDRAKQTDFDQKILSKLMFTGYLDQRWRLRHSSDGEREIKDLIRLEGIGSSKLIVCTVGGGQDGCQLVSTFAQVSIPEGYHGILITGPDMADAEKNKLEELANSNKRISFFHFISEPSALINMADVVISMGGYNSVCDILSFQKPALIVPRVSPRTEQYIRATNFSKLGMLDVLHPDALSVSALETWINNTVRQSGVRRLQPNMNGLENILKYFEELVRTPEQESIDIPILS